MLKSWIAAVVVVSLSACSFAMKTVPDGWVPRKAPECDSALVYPVGSMAVGVGLLGVAAGFGFAEAIRESIGESEPEYIALAIAGLAGAGLNFISAGVGFRNRGRCRTAHRAHLVHPSGPTPFPIAKPDPPEPIAAHCALAKQRIREQADPQKRLDLIKSTPTECLR